MSHKNENGDGNNVWDMWGAVDVLLQPFENTLPQGGKHGEGGEMWSKRGWKVGSAGSRSKNGGVVRLQRAGEEPTTKVR